MPYKLSILFADDLLIDFSIGIITIYSSLSATFCSQTLTAVLLPLIFNPNADVYEFMLPFEVGSEPIIKSAFGGVVRVDEAAL